MDSGNLFATADSSAPEYGVNIKMTNRGGGGLMASEPSGSPEGHVFSMGPQRTICAEENERDSVE